MNYSSEDVAAFIKEREEKLGGKLILRIFATYFAELGGEEREHGVLIYSDGKSLVWEDFFHPSTVLGFRVNSKSEKKREEEYSKMEIIIPIEDITTVELCSYKSVQKSLKTLNDVSKRATFFNKIFTKTRVKVKAGERIFFFEQPSYREFKQFIFEKGEII